MSEMVGRVARAIFLSPGYTGEPPVAECAWDEQDERICKELARAAIAAMREPTEPMKAAGSETIDFDERADTPLGNAACCWRAMIEAALVDQ